MVLSLFKKARHKQIYERPTKYFAMLVALLFALFLQAYMHNFNIVYITLFTLFSVAYIAHFIGRANVKALMLELRISERLFANQTGSLSLILNNMSMQNAYMLAFDVGDAQTELSHINAQASVLHRVAFSPTKRGVMLINSVTLYSYYPFYLQRFSRQFDVNERLVVFAQPVGVSLLEFLLKADHFSPLHDELKQLRAFKEGDTMSSVHWPSVAKGEWLSKEFHHNIHEQAIALRYDEIVGSHEEKLSQLCLWVLECEKMGLEATLFLPDEQLFFDGGDATELLEAIACCP